MLGGICMLLSQEHTTHITCSDFIEEYCIIYDLDLKPVRGAYLKGRDSISYKILVYLLRYQFRLSYRLIGLLTHRTHQDIHYHYKSTKSSPFYRQEAIRRFNNVRSVYED